MEFLPKTTKCQTQNTVVRPFISSFYVFVCVCVFVAFLGSFIILTNHHRDTDTDPTAKPRRTPSPSSHQVCIRNSTRSPGPQFPSSSKTSGCVLLIDFFLYSLSIDSLTLSSTGSASPGRFPQQALAINMLGPLSYNFTKK